MKKKKRKQMHIWYLSFYKDTIKTKTRLNYDDTIIKCRIYNEFSLLGRKKKEKKRSNAIPKLFTSLQPQPQQKQAPGQHGYSAEQDGRPVVLATGGVKEGS